MGAAKSIIPAGAVFDDRLSRTDLAVLCALGTHTSRAGRCWPATTLLAANLRITERRVRGSLRHLEEHGWILTTHRPGQSSIYELVFQDNNPGPYEAGVTPLKEQNPGPYEAGGADPIRPGTPDPIRPPNDTKNDSKNDDAARYAFKGEIIKLNQQDLDAWIERYHGIPDLAAELQSLDWWYAHKDTTKGKSWFHRAQRSLNEKHQERLSKQGKAGLQPEIPYNDGVY